MRKGFFALILAAGKGTRFKSEMIKVLHPMLGKSMLRLVLDCVFKLRPEKVYVVVGSQKEDVMKEAPSGKVEFLTQKRQLGTAHAVQAAKNALNQGREKDVLIINSDLPLMKPETLRPLLALHRKEGNSLTFLSAELEDPSGFGRIVHSGDKIRVIEERDATAPQRRIKEVNAGVYVFKIKDLLEALPKVSNKNKKGEYYLTDVTEILSQEGKKIGVHKTRNTEDLVGVNSRYELAKAIGELRERKIKALTEKGVTVYDPRTTWIDLDVKIGPETIVYSSVIIEGNSVIGSECRLYPFVHIVDSRVGNRVKILGSTMIEESVIEDEAQVGPFTHFRPKTVIKSKAKVGNFVEMKNTIFGRKSKAGHLTYLGDCEVKEEVNIGAGTITCNYDGKKKYKTFIESGVFIGSGTELVAPLKVGKKAYIGAGSTITKDVAPESLAVARSKQVEKRGKDPRKRGK
ncbi:MAG: UDP-N-acetylglucosamine diphosphorylase/glucosamine-1-phosphate N-acetyltransferase [Candidatus Aminicenantes bacterium]|nr:MAG: UDP-N-acetylglucosamine diphosphorylase/glucosamine-1-phosphate N-acetyltransferase [Candidatus Aminicenantes bacterium]